MHTHTKKNSHSACKRFEQRSACVLSFVHSSTHLHPFLIHSRCSLPQTVSQGQGPYQTLITNNHSERVIRQVRKRAGGGWTKGRKGINMSPEISMHMSKGVISKKLNESAAAPKSTNNQVRWSIPTCRQQQAQVGGHIKTTDSLSWLQHVC